MPLTLLLNYTGKWIRGISGNLLHYIDKIYEDQEVRANLYSKAAWTMGNLAILKQDYREALWYTKQRERVLAENGILLHLPQFLERILVTKDSSINLR